MRLAERATRTSLEKLILWHLWACAPFALPWLIMPDVFGQPGRDYEIPAMRILFFVIGGSLVLRTWVIYRGIRGAWPYVWPLLDTLFITLGAYIGDAKPDNWVILLYVLPVLQAAATLDLRWSAAVAVIGAVACGVVSEGGLENLRYSYFLFRLSLLVLVASLVTQLAKGLVRARSRLEMAQYRSELSSEMHDGLQQYLGAISMRLEMVERDAERDPARVKEGAEATKTIARQASDELRLMLHRLRSPILEQGNLLEALRYQAALFGERSPVPIEVSSDGKPRRLEPKVEHALLRIAQEAINNALKHAEANRIEVSLDFEEGQTTLSVRDDGKGFDPAVAGSGLGSETIRNRAESIGGTVAVRSAQGSGTTLVVSVPDAA